MPSRAQICYIARTMNGWMKSDYLAWMMTVLRWRQTCSMAPTADRGRCARIWAHLVSNDSDTSDSEEHCFVKFGSAKILVRRVKGITNSRHVGPTLLGDHPGCRVFIIYHYSSDPCVHGVRPIMGSQSLYVSMRRFWPSEDCPLMTLVDNPIRWP